MNGLQRHGLYESLGFRRWQGARLVRAGRERTSAGVWLELWVQKWPDPALNTTSGGYSIRGAAAAEEQQVIRDPDSAPSGPLCGEAKFELPVRTPERVVSRASCPRLS